MRHPNRPRRVFASIAREGHWTLPFVWALPLLALLSLATQGCAHRRPAISRAPAPPPAPQPSPGPAPSQTTGPLPRAIPGGYVEEGLASWYGVPYHGRRAANGEIYDMYKLTAAHRTLAFDSIVRVTNLKNGRETEVRITDRGPFVENRIIDLSLAAAREVDMVGMGVAPVRLELLAGSSPLEGNFTVQVGAFLVHENADRIRQRLEQRYQPVFIQEYDSPTGLFYRVRVGRVLGEEAARRLADQLRSEEGLVPFVVRLDD